MTRLQLKRILLVDSDPTFLKEFNVFLSMEGAKCTVAHSIESAKKALAQGKFELLVCSQKFPDGTLKDLVGWCGSKALVIPVALHEADPFSRTFDLPAVTGILDKNDPEESIDLISSMIGDAVKVSSAKESNFDLAFIFEVNKKEFQLNGIEVSEDRLFFTTVKCFDANTQGILRVRFQIGTVIETYTVSGYFEQSQVEGQNFRIQEAYLASWTIIQTRIRKWQDDINEYLNKACGS